VLEWHSLLAAIAEVGEQSAAAAAGFFSGALQRARGNMFSVCPTL